MRILPLDKKKKDSEEESALKVYINHCKKRVST